MKFADRLEAADLLAEKLRHYRDAHPVVLGIPRGAIEMGIALANQLGGEFDIVLVRKLCAPGDDEFAIGAIDESGWSYLAPFAAEMGIADSYIEEEKTRQLALLKQRRARFTPGRDPIDLADRIAIVVDDGLATGATMLAALHATRARRPLKLICAVPVSSTDAIRLIRPHADEVVCLTISDSFNSVSQFYRSFPQVTDVAAEKLMREAGRNN